MPSWIASLIAVATIATVYVFCVRPMRKGRCAMRCGGRSDAELDRQISDLRDELRMLRSHDASSPDRRRPMRQAHTRAPVCE
jgi:hypothetical protein